MTAGIKQARKVPEKRLHYLCLAEQDCCINDNPNLPDQSSPDQEIHSPRRICCHSNRDLLLIIASRVTEAAQSIRFTINLDQDEQ